MIQSKREAVELFPPSIQTIIVNGIDRTPEFFREVYFANDEQFTSPQAAVLSSLINYPRARSAFRAELAAKKSKTVSRSFENIVVGGGLHAAVLASVLEDYKVIADPSGGGVYEYPGGPAFYLNSRNRPGEGGRPRKGKALNYIPGALFQASDINGQEYQTNDDFALAIMVALKMRRSPLLGPALNVVPVKSGLVVETPTVSVNSQRVLIAIGSGTQISLGESVPFLDFMRSMVMNPFPLKDVKKAAVIGAGDSGRVAVEALLGLGPVSAPASVSFVERIDWFGQKYTGCESYIANNRIRYHQIAQSFPNGRSYSRIRPLTERVEDVRGGRVNTDNGSFGGYDLVVNCTGVEPIPLSRFWEGPTEYMYGKDGKPIARKAIGQEIYWVGPCAQLPASPKETAGLPDNTIAAWRYTAKTAELGRWIQEKMQRTS